MTKAAAKRDVTVRRNPDILFREIEGESVLLDPDQGTYYTLNETGTAVWNLIEEPTPVTGLIATLLEQYEVTPEQAKSEVDKLLQDLQEHRLVEMGES